MKDRKELMAIVGVIVVVVITLGALVTMFLISS
ncbi:hypothetical protein ES703_87530 [subsurface metagenome]